MPPRSRRSSSPHPAPPNVDLDEIAPWRFLIFNPRVTIVLSKSGAITGRLFELADWRREGLLARLRSKGFTVRTLDDRLLALPELPPPAPIGEPAEMQARRADRYSVFDPPIGAWRAIPARQSGDQTVVSLRAGWVVRRRHGRGSPSYHQAVRSEAGIELRPLSATEALLAGYAQAAQNPQATIIRATADERGYLLPAVEAPEPHRELLQRLGELTTGGWLIAPRGWPLARAVYERLGLRVEEPETPPL